MKNREKIFFVIKRMVTRFIDDGTTRSAAELAFYLLFSVFPLLMLLNSLVAMVHIPSDWLTEITKVLPVSVQDMIVSYLVYLDSTSAFQPFVLGVGLTLYFASRAVRSMMHSFEDIYGKDNRHGPIKRILISLLMTVLVLSMIVCSMFLLVIGRRVASLVGKWFPQIVPLMLQLRGVGVLVSITVLLLFLVVSYRLLPGVKISWRDAMPGACFSLASWAVLMRCFTYYVDNMARYNLLYGALGAIIVLMVWLNMSAMMLLLGAEFNYVLTVELRQREKEIEAYLKNEEEAKHESSSN